MITRSPDELDRKKYLRLSEAETLGYGTAAGLYGLVRKGKLKAYRFGDRNLVVRREDLEARLTPYVPSSPSS